MARGKKKENLTPEERLQVALVPEKEQPYNTRSRVVLDTVRNIY